MTKDNGIPAPRDGGHDNNSGLDAVQDTLLAAMLEANQVEPNDQTAAQHRAMLDELKRLAEQDALVNAPQILNLAQELAAATNVPQDVLAYAQAIMGIHYRILGDNASLWRSLGLLTSSFEQTLDLPAPHRDFNRTFEVGMELVETLLLVAYVPQPIVTQAPIAEVPEGQLPQRRRANSPDTTSVAYDPNAYAPATPEQIANYLRQARGVLDRIERELAATGMNRESYAPHMSNIKAMRSLIGRSPLTA